MMNTDQIVNSFEHFSIKAFANTAIVLAETSATRTVMLVMSVVLDIRNLNPRKPMTTFSFLLIFILLRLQKSNALTNKC